MQMAVWFDQTEAMAISCMRRAVNASQAKDDNILLTEAMAAQCETEKEKVLAKSLGLAHAVAELLTRSTRRSTNSWSCLESSSA